MGKHHSRKDLGDHAIGYCRPPKRKPGDSKKARAAHDERSFLPKQVTKDFFAALEEKIPINVNGKKKKLPAREVIDRQLIAQAAKGEAWAIRRVIDQRLKLSQNYADDQQIKYAYLRFLEQQEKVARKPDPERALTIKVLRQWTQRLGLDLFDPEVVEVEVEQSPDPAPQPSPAKAPEKAKAQAKTQTPFPGARIGKHYSTD